MTPSIQHNYNEQSMHCPPALVSSAPPQWPVHLTRSSEGGWCWWRDAVLRSAGFPAEMILSLSDAPLAACARQLTAARAALEQACQEALAHVSQRVAQQRAGAADAEQLRALGRANKVLRRREPASFLLDLLPRDLYERVCLRAAEHGEMSAGFVQQYAAALERQSKALAAVAADPLFRQAVTWQNHAAIDMVLDPLMRQDSMPGSKRKQREALVANYLQRYSLKNDTIGFFGPMAWVRVGEAASQFEAGQNFIRRRTVRFEDWAVSTLAERFAAQDDVLPSLIPRRHPFIRLEGRQIVLPGGARVELPQPQFLVLAACDGVRTVGAIVRGLLANPFSPFAGEAQIHALVRQLEREERIALTFPVSSCSPQPELGLRQHLQQIENSTARERTTQQLDRLVAARDDIAHAAGDETLLKTRMAALDAVFLELTGAAGRRRPGEVYGGRALVYEDCHRDTTLALSAQAIEELRRPLDLIVTSARWLTCEAANSFHGEFLALFEQMACAGGVDKVPFCDLWLQIQTLLFNDHAPIAVLAATLRERWQALLQPYLASGERQVSLRSQDIAKEVKAAFPSSCAGWNLARYQCPDLMFCAPDAAALLAGDFLAVMGEVHLGGNTVVTNLFVSQHPDEAALLDAMRSDLGHPYVLPKLSPAASNTPIRTQWIDDPQGSTEVLFSSGLVPANSATAVPISELLVELVDGRLMARRIGHDWQAELLDVLGDFLSLSVMNRFGLLKKGARTPRITIDKLVVQREAWQFARADIAAILDDDEARSFLAMQSWADSHQMPHAVFAKVPWEDKPFFVDFTSPVFVRQFAKQIRRAEELGRDAGETVALSEMLPAFEHLWLNDGSQRMFTSELRIVCMHKDDVCHA
ncbi:hypothetical protein GJ700_11840 [Duganella sp. FT92W]|uniref:Lantibiotic dehydratase N-terminal domain-containing protein n=1 Tax=Pseudoduganella rivuli TaxID=2666085 RepID=A0A7X2IM67_9BURK|nr:lantibiotic dehydratase [Pseudoduganella rivuli]MRV72401.1 hypothetical protein [Pseudoduganella rivuli]